MCASHTRVVYVTGSYASCSVHDVYVPHDIIIATHSMRDKFRIISSLNLEMEATIPQYWFGNKSNEDFIAFTGEEL